MIPPKKISKAGRIEQYAMNISRAVLLLLLVSGKALIDATVINVTEPTEWWQTATLYQIWPSSFKDSDGDGIGDLNGITSKLNHLVDMGVEVLWLSPIYPSPMVDSGYDISNFVDIYPTFGTLQDFDNLVATAKKLGLKVILDYVPNHTSDEHEWFIKSKAGIEPYTDYFVWNKGIVVNGTRKPPNNWLCAFNSGSAWEWVEEREAYYLHQFSVHQVDLNFLNPRVIQETKDIMTFWFDRGVDGFRIDSMPYPVEDPSLPDEPLSGLPGYSETDYYYLDHIYTKDRIENYHILQTWREHVDNYTATVNDGATRIIFTEAYANISSVMKYYNFGSNVPFNFFFIKDKNGIESVTVNTAIDVVDIINTWMENMPDRATANWVFGNHDNSRVATKYGSDRIDGINFLLYLLPGVAVTYNGDEIGMTDTYLTWEETQDPQACSTDETRYQPYSRDPERTPYQWDNTTSAGFSTNSITKLPVNQNYLTLNLATEKEVDVSHYKNVQAAIKLRSNEVIRHGTLDAQVIGESVVAFARELDGHEPVVVLINWDNITSTCSLEVFENIPDNMKVLISDVNSGITVGDRYTKTRIELPAYAAVVLQGITDE
ncbi:alpha-glucosidase-like [Neodiprion virginianus]|uniref:alpha-glucosidase-like n=1 Tax=Neodiprion virginianus TaxID=2961670 RepID=UPI001EE72DCA|nr:alpha-glucosidase-like [Neodiprion virginianus]